MRNQGFAEVRPLPILSSYRSYRLTASDRAGDQMADRGTGKLKETDMEKYNLDDLQIDVWDLHRLLVSAYDVIHEMPYERNGERDHDLDHVASLLRIARDFSERISKATDSHYHEIRDRPAVVTTERQSA